MKISKILLTIFAIGVLLALFAGVLAALGYVAALIIGGETATAICLFIYDSYFPWVIRLSSVSVGFGLIGMYFAKVKTFTVGKSTKKDTEDDQ